MAIIKQLKKYAALYIGVIVIYMAALLLVYAIPNSAVAENVKISQEYLELEVPKGYTGIRDPFENPAN